MKRKIPVRNNYLFHLILKTEIRDSRSNVYAATTSTSNIYYQAASYIQCIHLNATTIYY